MQTKTGTDFQALFTSRNKPVRVGSTGWLSINCPFCGDEGGHLGFPPSGRGSALCFKCGKHSLWETVAAALNISLLEARKLCDQFPKEAVLQPKQGELKSERPKEVQLPDKTGPFDNQSPEWRYLAERGFNPKILGMQWGVHSCKALTGPWAYRLIIPYFLDGRLVTYQGRDWTGKQERKYINLPNEQSIYGVKELLYGEEYVPSSQNWILVTEGVTKVWRFGSGCAVSTGGADVSEAQLKRLLRFQYIFILFDGDQAGRNGSWDLSKRLSLFGNESLSIHIVTVPGVVDVAEDCTYYEAAFIKWNILKSRGLI